MPASRDNHATPVVAHTGSEKEFPRDLLIEKGSILEGVV